MRPKICNRTTKDDSGRKRFVLPADDWYHIEVTGEHTNREAGIVQVIDDVAVNSMVRNFDPGETGILIDTDHFSHDLEKSTVSYGWLEAVKNRGGELYGKIRWTNTGEPAVTGGDFRLFSSEYDPADLEDLGNRRMRPLKLDGLTLTNRPNNTGGKPISNRGEGLHSSRPADAPTPAEKSGEGDDTDAPTKKTETMKEIAKALGLPEDASQDAILAEISKRKKDKATMKNRVDELEGDLKTIKNREVDDLMEEHKGFIGEDADSQSYWRDGLVTNRKPTEKQLIAKSAEFAKKQATQEEPKTRLHNRKTARQPAGQATANTDDKGAEQKALVEGIRITNRCSHNDAWSQAKRERPDLF